MNSKKTPTQKYAAEPAERSLCIRVTEKVATSFKQFCRKRSMTQSQAMAYFLSGEMKQPANLLVEDLKARLEVADNRLKNAEEKIRDLQSKLQGGKIIPKKYQAARLQNELLAKFFELIPPPEEQKNTVPKRYSFRESGEIFPEQRLYSYPQQDGVVMLRLEHIQYGKHRNPPLFIYGEDLSGKQIKLRWYWQRVDRYGRSLWDNPYITEYALWLFAVQITEGVADMVGALPLIPAMMTQVRKMEADLFIEELVREQMEIAEETNEECKQKEERLHHSIMHEEAKGETLSLDEVIRRIEEGKGS